MHKGHRGGPALPTHPTDPRLHCWTAGIWECCSGCTSPACQLHKVVTAGVKPPLEVFRTRNKGWGLRSSGKAASQWGAATGAHTVGSQQSAFMASGLRLCVAGFVMNDSSCRGVLGC